MPQLSSSVGLGGRNRPHDVGSVQRLLLRRGVSPGPVDQRCGIRTIHAIEHFQHRFLRHPDGRVDVGGTTWRHLEGTSPAGVHVTARASSRPAAIPVQHPVVSPAPRAPATAAHPVETPPPAHPAAAPVTPPPAEPSSYWQAVTPLVAWSEVNQGLQSPPNSVVVPLLGPPTGAKTEALIVTAYAGPLHVTGLRPAVASLAAVLARVSAELPSLYTLLGTPGMRAVRPVRGSTTHYSNHSWGIAIDLTVGRVLVPLAAHYSIRGIDALVPYFNAAGWFWGGGYHGRKDPMHFECSSSLLRSFGL